MVPGGSKKPALVPEVPPLVAYPKTSLLPIQTVTKEACSVLA